MIEAKKDIQWAAGILDGEGCFGFYKRTNRQSYACAIHCEMTDEDTIQNIQEVLQVGNICFRENKRKDRKVRKPSWILSIQKNQDIFNTLIKIMPYLSQRRLEKCRVLFDYLEPKMTGVE